MTGIDIPGTDITGFDITGIDFTGFDITGFDITGIDITGSDFTGIAMTGIWFGGSGSEDLVWGPLHVRVNSAGMGCLLRSSRAMRSGRSLSSPSIRKVWARPEAPALPHRPMRWTYCSTDCPRE